MPVLRRQPTLESGSGPFSMKNSVSGSESQVPLASSSSSSSLSSNQKLRAPTLESGSGLQTIGPPQNSQMNGLSDHVNDSSSREVDSVTRIDNQTSDDSRQRGLSVIFGGSGNATTEAPSTS